AHRPGRALRERGGDQAAAAKGGIETAVGVIAHQGKGARLGPAAVYGPAGLQDLLVTGAAGWIERGVRGRVGPPFTLERGDHRASRTEGGDEAPAGIEFGRAEDSIALGIVRRSRENDIAAGLDQHIADAPAKRAGKSAGRAAGGVEGGVEDAG